MHHRHLNHTEFTLAVIEDILARGRMPDWVPLVTAIRADPNGETAAKTLLSCERPLYAAPVFHRVIAAARNPAAAETSPPSTFPNKKTLCGAESRRGAESDRLTPK